MTSSLFRSPQGDSLMNFTSTTFVPFLKMFSTSIFALPRDSKDTEYTNVVMKATVDLCKMREGVRGNFITRMVMEFFDSLKEPILKCPLKPRYTECWNYKLTSSQIPTYLLINDIKFMLEMRHKAKLSNSKLLIHIYTLKLYGLASKLPWIENVFVQWIWKLLHISRKTVAMHLIVQKRYKVSGMKSNNLTN